MAQEAAAQGPILTGQKERPIVQRIGDLPWWGVILFVVIAWVFYFIFTDVEYADAFSFITQGLWTTISTSLIAYGFALVLGLLAGLGRISRSRIISNIATFYVEVIRGIPMLVLIFFIAFVAVPTIVEDVLQPIGGPFTGLENSDVSMQARAIIALAFTYGAFLAEIFRAGIQSIGRGQMEAARSLGMSHAQAMRYIILPQAVRNVLPALGNDFIAMVKDSSLISVLAVRDMTQLARLYAGRTFRFDEVYTVLAIMYLTITVLLSLVLGRIEKWVRWGHQ